MWWRGLTVFCCCLIKGWGVAADPCSDEVLGTKDASPTVSGEVLSTPFRFEGSDGQLYFLADLSFLSGEADELVEAVGRRRFYVFSIREQADRWGRKPAILVDEKHLELGVHLVRTGVAIVKPQFRSFNCLKFLIKLEQDARNKAAGIWADKSVISDYRSIDYNYWGEYWVVESAVVSVGQTRSRTYLNFGERWTEDLTGIIQRGTLEDFSGFGHDLSRIKGKRVRLRGVLQINKGPQIELMHPAQLELLD